MQAKNDELMGMIVALQSRDRISPGQTETPTRMHSTALDFCAQNDIYVAFSQAVGMPRFLVNYKYALRNAFSSTLTLIGFLFPLMIGGAFVVEKVFASPGVARFGADAILANDYNAIVGVTLVICLFVVVVNFVTEGLYVALDPRIRLER